VLFRDKTAHLWFSRILLQLENRYSEDLQNRPRAAVFDIQFLNQKPVIPGISRYIPIENTPLWALKS
jgi:hypothetical protein